MSATALDRAGVLSRRTLLAGAAGLAALGTGAAAATVPAAAPRMTLPVGPFIAHALDDLVAEGRMRSRDAVARHLDGIGAFRADDDRPLTIADLDPSSREVDRFLATMLIERLSGESLAAHLQRRLLAPFGMRDARVLGSSPVVGIDCRAGDALRWLDA